MEALLERLTETIKDLGGSVTEMDWRAYHFLLSLRSILTDNLKKSSFLPLSAEITPIDTAEYISSLPLLSTVFEDDSEREMAWLMIGLNEGLLGCYLNVFLDNQDMCSQYYSSNSIVRSNLFAKVVLLIDTACQEKDFRLDISEYAKFRKDSSESNANDSCAQSIRSHPVSTGSKSAKSPEPSVSGMSSESKGLAQVIDLHRSMSSLDPSSPLSLSLKSSAKNSSSDWSTEKTSEYVDSGLLSQLYTYDSNMKYSRLPPDKGLVDQSFCCPLCNHQIIIVGSDRCNLCGLYICHKCIKPVEQIIPSKVLRNWDFNKHNICKQCQPDLNALIVDVSAIVPFAVEIDSRFAAAWSRRCNEVLVAGIVSNACLHHAIMDVNLIAFEDLCALHSGIDLLAGEMRDHLAKCKQCRRQCSVCCVCRDGTTLIPLITPAMFCGKCGSGWHVECERGCPFCA